jgi:NAD(P)-dependent dehydrogenase (short-subunit alcohol dehydrogenase family)
MARLDGKVALVAGGATSIGAAIATTLHGAGARVAIVDLNEGEGGALAARLGARALFRRADLTDDAELAAAVGAAAASFGGIDILVSTVCTFLDKGLGSSRAEWLQSFNANVVTQAILIRETAPHMRARGGGAVVLFGSIAGKFGQRGRALYPVSKAAIQQLVRNAAMELAPDRIRVNAISPGWTWSTVIERLAQGDRAKADRIGGEYHPLGRIADAEDVARAALFLVSDEARHVTGIDLPVDGGYAITGPDRGTPAMGRLGE